MFCRKTMLPFGSHQPPLYGGSQQNRLNGNPQTFKWWENGYGSVFCPEGGQVGFESREVRRLRLWDSGYGVIIFSGGGGVRFRVEG